MDLTSPKFFQAQSLFPSSEETKPAMEANASFYETTKGNNKNPFAESFTDPLCKLNLKETSDFIKSLPISTNNIAEEKREKFSAQKSSEATLTKTRLLMEAPCTPGRPFFSFSTVSRKNFPSKWDDAEKWVMTSHDSPAHHASKNKKHLIGFKQQAEVVFSEKSRVTEEKVARAVSAFQGSVGLDHHCSSNARAFDGSVSSPSADVFLKDKFTDEVQQILPKHKSLDPSTEGFLFRNSTGKTTKDTSTEIPDYRQEAQHRDIGTEMTPMGSSTTSRCHTPFKSSSPARHNTPSNMSGPLVGPKGIIDISQFNNCHLAKLQLSNSQFDSVTSNWSSREEEEEEISKSLRHFDMESELHRNVSESGADMWEEDKKTKYCQRYQREEARIQAWVNLQSAKAEAQSRKLEVKIQKMRSSLEEKIMKKMAMVHRKAEEWRATARQQHTEQMQRTAGQARGILNRHGSAFPGRSSCGCLPCTKH